MSAFCVFGMTEPMAKTLAARKSPPKETRGATDEEIDAWRREQVDTILKQGKARQVSGLFDAPQFCRDWIDLASRTTRVSRLKVMVRDIKTDKHGNEVLNKRTKLPVMTWRAL